jgi:hypothetical protein
MNRHPLEEVFNAPAWDILSAIHRGFRAQIDVKGKLAEYYFHRQLVALEEAGFLRDLQWLDVDGQPDFIVTVRGRTLRIECKNVRNERYRNPETFKVELQRTRNSKDGTPTRAYRGDEFDVLAACLFNQTGRWEYFYTATRYLARRKEMPELLVIMQRVPMAPADKWRGSLEDAIRDALE